MVEVITVAAILGLITTTVSVIWIGVIKAYDGVSTQTYTNSDAITGMQRIVTDVREAKSIQILNGGTRLRVQFPIKHTDGSYDRHQLDANNYVDYYRSDATGSLLRTGDMLWRNKGNGAESRIIERDVRSVQFDPDTERSVKITVTSSNPSLAGTKQIELTQRVVYMRNY